MDAHAQRRMLDPSSYGRRPLSQRPVTTHAVAQRKPERNTAGLQKEEDHKVFDEAVIVVRAGKGGKGEICSGKGGKMVKNFKYRAGGTQPQQMWLPAAKPSNGADGGNVVYALALVADPTLDNLLHLHARRVYSAPNGANGNPAAGSSGPRAGKREVVRTPALRVGVPLGTVVKRNRGGALVGELTCPGQALLVAAGGRGGLGLMAPRAPSRRGPQEEEGWVEDRSWAADAEGAPGEEAGLRLLMRVVADVGLVGTPNAGKSSLLAALTRASPEVAPYPFTTLMPNLGVMAAPAGDFESLQEARRGSGEAAPAVLADLPGLIAGAHTGRGLGRAFLRHLRRTRVLLHVVDAAGEDPGADYEMVRQELALYNPAYPARPHLVALNKMDLPDAAQLRAEVEAEVWAAARRLQAQEGSSGGDAAAPCASLPSAVVCVSAKDGTGLAQLRAALEAALPSESASLPAMRGGEALRHIDAPGLPLPVRERMW